MPGQEQQNRKLNEAYLWENLISGKEWALSRLFHLYYHNLFFFASGYIKDHEEVKDIIQDLFIKIWVNRGEYGKVSHVKAYLFKVLRSMIVDYFRVQKKADNYKQTNSLPQFDISHEDDLILQETEAENYKNLQQAMDNLTSREKEIIYLRFFAKVEYDKIGSIMNIKYQSLRNVVHSALKKMKKTLEK